MRSPRSRAGFGTSISSVMTTSTASTPSSSPQEGTNPTNSTNGSNAEKLQENTDGVENGTPSPRTKLYTDAYTHGYTEGYIEGNGAPRNIPIAIVGMSCRLPGSVSTPDEFWELCSRARSGWSEIPKERFEAASFYHPTQGKTGCFNAVGGNFLKEDVGLFDAPFFNLTAQEATSMDPQQRILLECTFEALDNAGIPKHEIVGKDVGVFIGGSFSEYESQSFVDTDNIPMYQATGCAFAMQSNRISHFFDLRGPSFTLDTACSSSLVALHQACQSLRTGESKSAIVGGCHLNMLPEFWISMAKSRLFSSEGRSFSFDSRGTGYGRGEGCGFVILKPLDQALKDNDNIRSVIVASGISQDGKTPGITMPNGAAQESLMESVYKNAGISPTSTGYVEAHGTGTKVGDPIEAAALHKVFGEGRTSRNPLFIGSVKSNIGHLEAASGIISVIKTALMLERSFILPNFGFKKPNEAIPFAKWNLKVPITQRPWPRDKRFASINNFGFGGTNAHLVMERAPIYRKNEEQPDVGAQPRKLFVLSANNKSALELSMKNLGIYLEQRPEIFQNDLMTNLAYTLGQRRSLMQWRIAISTTSSFDLIQALNSGKVTPVRETDAASRIGFIFTGQGAQYFNMGRELYFQYPVYASTMDACDEYLASIGAPFSLLDELNKDADVSLINEAHISQPACTAIQLALTDLLRSWGISPTAVAGHSSGEIGAAYAAGILPLESCLAISYHRGMATKGLKKKHPHLKGSMMAVGATKEEIEPLLAQLKTKARIACFNSPTSLTISGEESAIDDLQKILEEKQVFNRKLQVDMAYHSHHMDLIAQDYQRNLQALDAPKLTQINFYSSLHGKLVDATMLEPSYWVENLTQSVRFSEAVTKMCKPDNGEAGVGIVIEIGPHSALAGPFKQILKACSAMDITYSSALARKKDAVEAALELASTLFVKGANLNMGAINLSKQAPEVLVDMPRYPWNHNTRYWHEGRLAKKHKNRTIPRHDLLGTLANYTTDAEPTWRNILHMDDLLPWLRHYQVQSLNLFPMAGFISIAVEAASQRAALRNVHHYDSFQLRSISVHHPLILMDEDIELTIQLRPQQESTLVSSDSWDEFRICSWTSSKGWAEHCKGLVAVKTSGITTIEESRRSEITTSEKAAVEKAKLYHSLSNLGVSYGLSFQGLSDCQASDNCSTATITNVGTAQEHAFQTDSVIHPTLLEQLIEMYWPVLGAGRASVKCDTVYLPSSIESMTISRNITELTKKPGDSLDAFCEGSFSRSAVVPIQFSMFATATNSDELLLAVNDLTVSPILERDIGSENDTPRELCYKLEWEPFAQLSDNITNGNTNATENGDPRHLNGLPNGTSEIVPNGVASPPSVVSDFPLGELIIVHGEGSFQKLLALELAANIEHLTGTRPALERLTTDLQPSGKFCLFISELEQNLLSSLTSDQFTALQKMLTSVEGVLWVVRRAYLSSSNPDANMITGLSRSIRSETLLKFATLDLDSEPVLCLSSTVQTILNVFTAVFGPKAEANCELEFAERKGALFTPRVINDVEMNEAVHKARSFTLEPTPFIRKDRPLQMAIGTHGALETLHFVDQSVEDTLAEDGIELEVKAIGMNSRDIQLVMGVLPNSGFGVECSGIVTKIGSKVTNVAIGDHVACLSVSIGVYSTYTRTKSSFAIQIKDETSFEAAAAIPVAYSAAYYGLIDLGRLLQSERVLIHGAASAAGQAAICLAEMMGAEVFAMVGSTESRKSLLERFSMQEDHISSSHISSFGKIAKGGFDIVLNCTSADFDTSRDLWESLSNFGRFVQIKKTDGHASAILANTSLQGNRSFMSVDLISLALERPRIMERLLSDVSGLLEKGKIQTPGLSIYSISDLEAAFNALKDSTTDSKLIVSPQPSDQVKATPWNKGNKLLRSDCSYILIGGTGGLGRSMARWMVDQGARNIVLVSRTGSVTSKVKTLIDDLAAVGANILVKSCDVCNAESVNNLIHKDMLGMPEIKGVVHGAMVLKDVLFEKMTYEQYTTVIEAKVRGAWNFHNALLSTKLDFFVAISSAAGAVGNRGQAAYSAANTFLNAFVQHRLKLGLPASSLDLTAVSDVGYLAENIETAAEVSKNLGSDTICEAEVLALLEAAIDGRLSKSCNNHTITGMRLTTSTFWTNDAKFKHLRLAAATETDEPVQISFKAALKASTSLPEAELVVQKALLNKLPSVLVLEAEDMDVTRSLSSYALDSLVAIEVRNFITREFEANLQVLELLGSGSIETLAKAICVKSKLVEFKEGAE
ncbi:BcPKS8, polyketide synthase [Mollisia scopiformis]|uniref:BcPKS8, polyketide synthase n=1 Tax=Mollisia scopiformis TaxID=149040 RepID=A0A132B9X0_MOLSC|nr:BcPKS8, polyketide synthase [Mollisia scopiformis]KUJ09043.1 BcPKS8, polyketide synthase [Mollisia scopiformis]